MLPAHKILLRYKTLDKCFRSSKKWSLEMLITHCSEVLKEKISKRSIQSDIQFLRDNGAPVSVVEKKYYAYTDKNYSFFEATLPLKLEQQFAECEDFIKAMRVFPKYQNYAECDKKSKTDENNNLHYVKSEIKQLDNKGYFLCESFYSISELRKIERLGKDVIATKKSLLDSEKLLNALLNENLKKLLKKIHNKVFLIDAVWNETQEPFEYQQHLELPMKERHIPKNLTLWGYPATENYEKADKKALYAQTFAIQIFLKNTDARTGALHLISGSHHNELSPLEIKLITNNTTPTICNIQKGGILVYKPMLIKKIAPSESPKLRPSITLWFSSYDLPVHYVWNNKVEI